MVNLYRDHRETYIRRAGSLSIICFGSDGLPSTTFVMI